MSDADDITEAWAEGFDAKREVLLGSEATLKLFEKKAGQSDAELVEITSGWYPESERVRGQVESLKKIQIAEQGDLTTEIMSRVGRVAYNGVKYTVENYEAPDEAPRLWTIYAREVKPGAVRR